MQENIKNKVELLSPAGDAERLNAAILFGADAVYLAGQEFGMRASQTNFDSEGLKNAVELCHKNQIRVYLTVNTLPRNDEIDRLPDYLKYVDSIGVDAIIASDFGVLSLIKEHTPGMEVHISTQAGVVNYKTAQAFYELGAKRVVVARELSLEEIKQIRERTSPELEIEAFVHGAMCMSFSGRCIISNYLTSRDANRGECAQPCRWGYHLVEEKRPGMYIPITEDEKGTYILNAKDMCMIEHIDEMIQAGITSFKIEGRAKSSYYVSAVTNAYRIGIDNYYKNPQGYKLEPWLKDEVEKVSHRRYGTGFYFGQPEQYYQTGGYIRGYDVVAVVEQYADGRLYLKQKNKFSEGDMLEILQPHSAPESIVATDMQNEWAQKIESAPHAEMKLSISSEKSYIPGSILRQKKD